MISELMQPIVNQNDLFVDNNNEPVVRGKVEFLDPVSNNFLTVYSYTDDEFVELENPIILDIHGRAEQSVFADRLAYCRLYSYHGLDEYNHPIYEFIRDWYAGHNAQSIVSENVYTLDALKNLNPEYNTRVTVIGYHSDNDCGPRYYYWDPNSTLDADNGYVVASNVDFSGRWILQFDGPYIPSTYYGVDPQHISNAPALLTYAVQISGKKTAPGIYFVPGHYQNQIRWTTTKRVLISSNSQFDNGIICSWVDVKGKPSTWIGDISVTDSSCPVHSSWYKSAKAFWNSGSRYKYADGRNWTDNVLTANSVQTKVHFYGADEALTTNTNGNMIRFDSCTFEGTGFLTSAMECGFVNCEFSDNYYLNASIDASKIMFSQLSGQQPTIIPRHFKNPNNVAKVASKITDVLDLDGLSCTGTVDATAYKEIRNGTFSSLTFGNNDSNSYTLRRVTVSDSLAFNGKNLYSVNSDIKLTAFPNITSFGVTDNSTIRPGWTLTSGTVNCIDSTWAMDTAKEVNVSLTDSIVNSTVKSRWMAVYNCRVITGKLQVYPIYVTDHYEYKFIAQNSVFDTDIEFVHDNIWDIYFNVSICNNTFNGQKGITCPYWTDVTNAKRTIAPYSSTGTQHILIYDGNRGSCPNGKFTGGLSCSQSTWYDFNVALMRGRSNPVIHYKCQAALAGRKNRYFVLENTNGQGSPIFDSVEDNGFGMKMGTDTNNANYSLVSLSELLADDIESAFVDWKDQQGLTPDNFNDYFYRWPALPASSFSTSDNYFFW
jgi:hypothetical protein